MKVKDLIAKLQTFDPELEVICQRYSDYVLVEDDDPFLLQQVKAVPQGGYIMRNHTTLPEEERLKLRDYVCFSGN